MRSNLTTNYGRELSWFLIPYLLMLLSALMLVHVLQPERDGPGSSSRSPVHQERSGALGHAAGHAAVKAGEPAARPGRRPLGAGLAGLHDV